MRNITRFNDQHNLTPYQYQQVNGLQVPPRSLSIAELRQLQELQMQQERHQQSMAQSDYEMFRQIDSDKTTNLLNLVGMFSISAIAACFVIITFALAISAVKPVVQPVYVTK